MHTAKALKNIRKILIVFTSKNVYVSTCILSFNNRIIKATRTRSIFQKYQKNALFSFSI